MDKTRVAAYPWAMRSFFEHYGESFVRPEMAGIADCFAYPCMITNEAGTDLICDAEALGQHVESFLASVQGLGVARAEPVILDDRVYGENNRAALVRWELFGRDGTPLDEPYGAFTYLYILTAGPQGWKIQLANLV